jgi:hypothetical protein
MSEGTATETSAASGRLVHRDDIVQLFGTPDETVGSVNEPRTHVEHGIEFNEKWVYRWPRNEPTRPRARAIYWKRYDFVASVRIEQDGSEVPEDPADLLRRRRAGH